MTSNQHDPVPATHRGCLCTRRYGEDDLARLKRITELVDLGINLAGVAQILELESENSQLQTDYTQLELLNARLKADRNTTNT